MPSGVLSPPFECRISQSCQARPEEPQGPSAPGAAKTGTLTMRAALDLQHDDLRSVVQQWDRHVVVCVKIAISAA